MKKTLKKFLLSCGLGMCVSAGQVQAAGGINTAASLANPMDNLGGAARATAMGSAFVSVADDATALWWNPAGLASMTGAQIGIHHNAWLAGISQDAVVGALPVAGIGTFALSGNFANYGSFQGYDSSGNATSKFTAGSYGFGAGLGRELAPGFLGGFGLKGASEDLGGYHYSTFSGDLGFTWVPTSMPGLRLAADYSNFGNEMGGSTQASAGRVGASYLFGFAGSRSLLLALSGQLEPLGVSLVQMGTEATVVPALALRAGYQARSAANQAGGLSGLSMGLGFNLAGVSLDYAFLPFGDLGNAQRVSLTYQFARPSARTAAGHQTTLEEALRLEKEQKYEEALAAFNAVLLRDDSSSAAWQGLGRVYEATGRRKLALRCMNQAGIRDPENPEILKWIVEHSR